MRVISRGRGWIRTAQVHANAQRPFLQGTGEVGQAAGNNRPGADKSGDNSRMGQRTERFRQESLARPSQFRFLNLAQETLRLSGHPGVSSDCYPSKQTEKG